METSEEEISHYDPESSDSESNRCEDPCTDPSPSHSVKGDDEDVESEHEPECSTSDGESDHEKSPMTKEEKLKNYWKQFAVQRDFHNPMCSTSHVDQEPSSASPSPSEAMPDDSNASTDSDTGDKDVRMSDRGGEFEDLSPSHHPVPTEPKRKILENVTRVEGGIHIPDSTATSSESGTTLVLGEPRIPKRKPPQEPRNPKAEPYEGSSDSSDDSSISYGDLVPEDAFADAMGDASVEAQHHVVNSGPSSSSKTTMVTPKCDRPNFWGFPLVETPPKEYDPKLMF